MVTSQALGQSYDCPNASEATMKDMDTIINHQATPNLHKSWILCIDLMKYCSLRKPQMINIQSGGSAFIKISGSEETKRIALD